MRRLLLLLFLLCAALAQDVILAIEVLDPGAQCQIYNGSACPSLVGLSVYSNSTFTVSVAELVAGELIASVVPLSIQFPMCARTLQHLLCASLFPLCQVITRTNGSALAIPRLPCEAYCAEVNLECADAFRATQQPPVGCAPNITYDDAGSSISPTCIVD